MSPEGAKSKRSARSDEMDSSYRVNGITVPERSEL